MNDVKYAAKMLANLARRLGWKVGISYPPDDPNSVDGFLIGTDEFLERHTTETWEPKLREVPRGGREDDSN